MDSKWYWVPVRRHGNKVVYYPMDESTRELWIAMVRFSSAISAMRKEAEVADDCSPQSSQQPKQQKDSDER
jgi:hypothetical protein